MFCLLILTMLLEIEHFQKNPILVTILGDYACKGLISQGVVPVIKHIPGHGRSNMDNTKNYQ